MSTERTTETQVPIAKSKHCSDPIDHLDGRGSAQHGGEPAQNPIYQKWTTDIEAIQSDLSYVRLARVVWRAENAVIAANSSLPPSAIFNVRARNYAEAQAVAVRRQSDTNSRTASLAGVMNAIKTKPAILSRESYVSHFEGELLEVGHCDFNSWACADGSHIEPAMVERDLAFLLNASAEIKTYVDKFIAHHDRNRNGVTVPTFSELDKAIEVLFDLFKKYYLILTATALALDEPVPQYDLLGPYRIPWIDPTR
jgi:AbiU2